MVKIYAVYSHYAKTTAKLSMHKFLQKLEICIFTNINTPVKQQTNNQLSGTRYYHSFFITPAKGSTQIQ